MALYYGMNITASDMRSLLEKNDKQQSGIRTWRQLFGNASLGFNAQSDALTTDYTDAIAKAYESNFKQNDAIMGAGLASGVTKEMLSASRNDLHTAYETYIRNYGSDMATAAETYGEEVGAIDAALTERATNFSNLYNSAYKYLSEELFGATQSVRGTAENGAVAKYNGDGKNAEFAGYEDVNRDYINEHGLQWIYELDEDGNPTTELRDWTSLSHDLFNGDGTLTKRGIAFFDQMFNTPYENYTHVSGERNIRSFDEWLSEQKDTFDNYDATNLPGMAKNGRELRDWWVSPDTFNYNFAGTNKGTSQTMTGRESTDDIYGAYEYADTHGMSEFAKFDFGESNEMFQQAMSKFAWAEEWARQCIELNVQQTAAQMQEMSMNAGNPYYVPTPYKPYTADEQYAEARMAWQTYYNTVSDMYGKLDKFFTEKMSGPMADQFWTENAKLRDEYNDLMSQAKASEYYNKDVANNINKWYNNLLKQMNAYIKKHGYDGKTSGF